MLRSASQAYQNYVRTLLTRNNTITGVLYKDDPTIMAVELSTKPHTRCHTACRVGDAWTLWAPDLPGQRLHAGYSRRHAITAPMHLNGDSERRAHQARHLLGSSSGVAESASEFVEHMRN